MENSSTSTPPPPPPPPPPSPTPTAEDSKFVGETCWPASPAYFEHGGPICLLRADGKVMQIVRSPGQPYDYVEVANPVIVELVKKKIEIELEQSKSEKVR